MSEQTETAETEAREQAIKLLARREHAPLELIRKLTQRGHEEAVARRAVDRLKTENLVSAKRYAESVARSRAERGQGPVRIAAELVRAGVDPADADAAIANAEMDWRALAAAVRRKRFGEAVPSDRNQRIKQMRFLQQRGFDRDDITAAIEGGSA